MKNTILLLRICYWWGIIADAVVAIRMLFPDLGMRYGQMNGAPLMIGWTLLLFWADRKPVERKDILLLTLPVIAGYVIVEVCAIFAGLDSLGQTLPSFILQAGLSSLIIFSYLRAKNFIQAEQKA